MFFHDCHEHFLIFACTLFQTAREPQQIMAEIIAPLSLSWFYLLLTCLPFSFPIPVSLSVLSPFFFLYPSNGAVDFLERDRI
jgi:hypothetical protein